MVYKRCYAETPVERDAVGRGVGKEASWKGSVLHACVTQSPPPHSFYLLVLKKRWSNHFIINGKREPQKGAEVDVSVAG